MGLLESSGELIAFWAVNSEPHIYLEVPDKLNVYGKLGPHLPLILSLSPAVFFVTVTHSTCLFS